MLRTSRASGAVRRRRPPSGRVGVVRMRFSALPVQRPGPPCRRKVPARLVWGGQNELAHGRSGQLVVSAVQQPGDPDPRRSCVGSDGPFRFAQDVASFWCPVFALRFPVPARCAYPGLCCLWPWVDSFESGALVEASVGPSACVTWRQRFSARPLPRIVEGFVWRGAAHRTRTACPGSRTALLEADPHQHELVPLPAPRTEVAVPFQRFGFQISNLGIVLLGRSCLSSIRCWQIVRAGVLGISPWPSARPRRCNFGDRALPLRARR